MRRRTERSSVVPAGSKFVESPVVPAKGRNEVEVPDVVPAEIVCGNTKETVELYDGLLSDWKKHRQDVKERSVAMVEVEKLLGTLKSTNLQNGKYEDMIKTSVEKTLYKDCDYF